MILEALLVFRLAGEVVSPAAEASVTRPVGSLQKPWVVAAWASAHPGEEPPLLDCTAASRCWKPAGHGRVDLSRAFAQSCNAWFLALARATPEDDLARALAAAGFELRRPLSPEAAIGLGPLAAVPRIAPAALLRAYRDLVSRPWPARDDLRRALVDGMRAAGRDGTGSALGRRGALVKTGTVPALDGRPLATSGWAVAADPDGDRVELALLASGTGAEAAAALGATSRGGSRAGGASSRASLVPTLPAVVRVRLLTELTPDAVTVANAGSAPIRVRSDRRDAWLGPGAALAAEPGLVVGPGLLRLDVSPYGLVRFVEGTLEASGRGRLRLDLATTPRSWVDGVVRGELGAPPPDRAVELGAAALRFLRLSRPRGATLCDSTHCAVFAGRGPAVAWVTPRRAETSFEGRREAAPPLLDDDAWRRVVSLATRPGPALFTGHCGGAPLSPFEVWGRGSREASPCPRHGALDAAPWERFLPGDALASAFGGRVVSLRAILLGGVRTTRIATGGGTRDLLYDDLHRALAPSLGWNALPSPPDAFEEVPGGFRVRGRGRGHRAGLCLDVASR